MSEQRVPKNGPGRIALHNEPWNFHDDSALTDQETPSSSTHALPLSQQALFSPPQWNPEQDDFHNIYTGDEPPEIPDKAPIPVALPMSSGVGVTPLPVLPMTVLSIVSSLSYTHAAFYADRLAR